MKQKLIIPVDPNEWTVDDWRDLSEGLEEIRRKISNRHSPHPTPPIDNDFVVVGCERFSVKQYDKETQSRITQLESQLREQDQTINVAAAKLAGQREEIAMIRGVCAEVLNEIRAYQGESEFEEGDPVKHICDLLKMAIGDNDFSGVVGSTRKDEQPSNHGNDQPARIESPFVTNPSQRRCEEI